MNILCGIWHLMSQLFLHHPYDSLNKFSSYIAKEHKHLSNLLSQRWCWVDDLGLWGPYQMLSILLKNLLLIMFLALDTLSVQLVDDFQNHLLKRKEIKLFPH